ncbi:16S rRNA endonuclease CdiA [Klebsiella oxytoca]|nr:16S rRNA endonuclease CdiA [Klebsiella oxytoca]CAF2921420.1 16S rRNA endonuclease CdiA [Klebsiella oxytoca]CAH5707475.1 16S rRNA endonuclease CdiA [Klebsiella oxytoca]CAH5739478.1 16S rRNA endonuclease CdiA [Klebsiella oxytoca]SQI84375.1 filamentous hemagglutinin family outer membrane protein [Klebsiella oxytoca]
MGGGSGSLNLSQSKMHGTWTSVEAQTGIFADESGFDVKVGGYTQLNGSVLASTATADYDTGGKNRRWRRRCSADTVYTAGTLTRICVASPRYPGRGWRGHYATTSISIITGWKRRLK